MISSMRKQSAGPQHAGDLLQDSLVSLVVEVPERREHVDDRVLAGVRESRVAHVGLAPGHVHAELCRLCGGGLQVVRGDVDPGDPVPSLGEPHAVTAGPAAQVEDIARLGQPQRALAELDLSLGLAGVLAVVVGVARTALREEVVPVPLEQRLVPGARRLVAHPST